MSDLAKKIESLLFISPKPLSAGKLAKILKKDAKEAKEVLEELASAWGGAAVPMKWGPHTKWQVRIDGKIPRIEAVANRLEGWLEVLRRHLPRLAERAASAETEKS